jgi:metal-sulfur cluster biosynthetic enzyme
MSLPGDDVSVDAVRAGLHTVIDPCMEAAGLGLSVVDLGLVRDIQVSASRIVVELGLTEPGCGFTHALVTRIDDALAGIAAAREVETRFNWREPWTEARMSEHGQAVFAGARERGSNLIASSRGTS